MVNIGQEKRAPRFRAYLDKRFKAIWMERSEWERLFHDQDEIIHLDIAITPFANMTRSVRIVGCYVEKSVDGTTTIKIFRYDPKDAPRYINLDKYQLWNDFNNPVVYSAIVISCSTCDDKDFRSFLGDYVFIIPMQKGSDHHIEELPDKYKKYRGIVGFISPIWTRI